MNIPLPGLTVVVFPMKSKWAQAVRCQMAAARTRPAEGSARPGSLMVCLLLKVACYIRCCAGTCLGLIQHGLQWACHGCIRCCAGTCPRLVQYGVWWAWHWVVFWSRRQENTLALVVPACGAPRYISSSSSQLMAQSPSSPSVNPLLVVGSVASVVPSPVSS